MAIERRGRHGWLSTVTNQFYRTEQEANAAETAFKESGPGKTIDKLTQQILGQGLTSKWSGEGHGSAEANARDMAKIMADAGITDIKQFGQIERPVTINQTVTPEFSQGGEPTGRFINPATGQYAENVQWVSDGVDGMIPVTPVQSTEKVFGNKETGQTFAQTYASDSTAWGGTYAGKGNTGYRVIFGDDGTPYFYTTGASSSDLGGLAPLIAMAAPFVLPGVGAAIAGAIGTSTAVGGAIASGLVSGTLAEATGGDFLKGAVIGAATAGITSGLADTIGTTLGFEGNVATAVGKGIIDGAIAEINGGDFVKAAVISGATSYISGLDRDAKAEEYLRKIEPGVGYDATTAPTEVDVIAAYPDLQVPGAITDVDIPTTPAVMPKIGDTTVTPANYDITEGLKFGKVGLDIGPPAPAIADGTGVVDYSIMPSAPIPFDGLKMPTAPSIADMGGGTGITVTKTDGSTLTESGVVKDYNPPLGDVDSFINKPAPDVPTELPASFDAKTAAKFLKLVMGASAINTVVDNVIDVDIATPPTLKYGDIYKDAPIKGFSMEKMQDESGSVRYMPKIGEKKLLDIPETYKPVPMAKGGFVKKRCN